MNKSITQDYQNEKQISASVRRFFTRFHVSSALKAANAYKTKGIPVIEIFQYLFILIFSNRSMYMDLLTGRNTPTLQRYGVSFYENGAYQLGAFYYGLICKGYPGRGRSSE